MKIIKIHHEKTDFGDRWYFDKPGIYRFAIYRYDDDVDTVYLSNVFVDEKYRGQGYGKYILSAAEMFASKLDADSILLKVKKNSFAHQLYNRHGFIDLVDDEDGDKYIWMKKSI